MGWETWGEEALNPLNHRASARGAANVAMRKRAKKFYAAIDIHSPSDSTLHPLSLSIHSHSPFRAHESVLQIGDRMAMQRATECEMRNVRLIWHCATNCSPLNSHSAAKRSFISHTSTRTSLSLSLSLPSPFHALFFTLPASRNQQQLIFSNDHYAVFKTLFLI